MVIFGENVKSVRRKLLNRERKISGNNMFLGKKHSNVIAVGLMTTEHYSFTMREIRSIILPICFAMDIL